MTHILKTVNEEPVFNKIQESVVYGYHSGLPSLRTGFESRHFHSSFALLYFWSRIRGSGNFFWGGGQGRFVRQAYTRTRKKTTTTPFRTCPVIFDKKAEQNTLKASGFPWSLSGWNRLAFRSDQIRSNWLHVVIIEHIRLSRSQTSWLKHYSSK